MIDKTNGLTNSDFKILDIVASLPNLPKGAFNVRKNGAAAARSVTENIDISNKADGTGIDIKIKAGTVDENVYIPVLLTESGLDETVANDFYVGENAKVTIVAGCGIHNGGSCGSSHNGVHTFKVGKGAVVKYVEKHYGEGTGDRVMNPSTVIVLEEGAVFELEAVQIEGITSANRNTTAYLAKDAKLTISERLVTSEEQKVHSNVDVYLNGDGSKLQVVSRSIAKDNSVQVFHPKAIGNSACFAHIQCDSIIMDKASVSSVPEICANCADAEIIHEAAIGRINNEQLLKLQTLGLTADEAEKVILEGFLS